MSIFSRGDAVLVKLSDADWTAGIVTDRETTGFGTPNVTRRYTVLVGWLPVIVSEGRIRIAS